MAITRAVVNVKFIFSRYIVPGETIKSSNLLVSFLQSKIKVSPGVTKFLYKVVLWFLYPNPAKFSYQEHYNYDTVLLFIFVQDGQVKCVIFCLSLMGTNLVDFLTEAHRILQDDGILWIAEVRKSPKAPPTLNSHPFFLTTTKFLSPLGFGRRKLPPLDPTLYFSLFFLMGLMLN